MTSKTFPKSQPLLLRGDGGIEPLKLTAGPFGPRIIVLARERCLFERMEAGPGLKAPAAAAAARLRADTGAPYQRAGSLLTFKDGVFGIWWWDAQWVGERLGGSGLDPAARIIPEPMARAAGEGWRIVKASSGYEAQLWKDGFLVADQWRRNPFDGEAWAAFVRTVPDAQGAGDVSPAAQSPAFTLNTPYRKAQASDWTPERSMQAMAAGLAVALVAAALWFVGQTMGLQRATEDAQAEIDQLKLSAPASASVQRQIAGLAALNAANAGADPMILLKKIQQVIGPYNHKILAFDATRDRIRLILPNTAAEDLRAMSQDLMDSAQFQSVRPTLDGKRGRLILDLVPKSAKPPAKAKG